MSADEYRADGKLRLERSDIRARQIPQYHPLKISLDLSASYENPFDPDQIDVWAEFTGPDNQKRRVNAFLDRPYSRSLEERQEKIAPTGAPAWKTVLTPDRVGAWSFRVRARDRSGTVSLRESKFEVVRSSHPGFIRRSRRNPAVFAFEGEKPYFAIGENMCWGGWNGQRGTHDYEAWLQALGKAGGNWIRIWMSSWNCALEWSADPSIGNGEYRGVGRYNLSNAWKLDRILDTAEQLGISTMLVFGTYGEFNEGGYFNEGEWKQNPYNAANGGPCAKPADFWTSERARNFYRRRLRYLVSRYGHRTGIHAWEFWNEAQAPPAWVAEMAKYLKSIDPYNHLVTTTYGNRDVWQIPEIDFTQTHHYGKGDVPDSAPVIMGDARAHAQFGKPHMMAEFGIDWRKGDENYDPEGLGANLHNGMWASLASGNAGTAMIWWWDGYVHPKGLYSRFTPIRRFADRIPWTSGPWRPLVFDGGADRVMVMGQTDGRNGVAWAHNPAHNWKSVFEKNPIPPTVATDLGVQGLHDGTYTIEWWDTWKGEISHTESVRVMNGRLSLKLRPIERDIALRISPA